MSLGMMVSKYCSDLPPRHASDVTHITPNMAESSTLTAVSKRPPRSEHIFVISATYFPLNKSYPANTMAVLFDGPLKPIENRIACWSRNATHEVIHVANTFEVRGSPYRCKWEGFITTCPVVHRPVEFGLYSADFGNVRNNNRITVAKVRAWDVRPLCEETTNQL